MILKINFENDWHIYDGLQRIRFGGSRGKRVYFLHEGNDIKDHWFVAASSNAAHGSGAKWAPFQPQVVLAQPVKIQGQERVYVPWACAQREPGGPEIFFVFQEGFLMNDEGATIETLR